MFNTELFIVEVQKRPCLWNLKYNSHSDREQKLQAWKEIAELLNASSHSYSLTSANITVEELQRKWKHLRDYYTREKKRESKTIDNDTEVNSSGRKKRKSSLLDMLQFLNVNLRIEIVETTESQRKRQRVSKEENVSQKSDGPEDINILRYCEESSQSKFQNKELNGEVEKHYEKPQSKCQKVEEQNPNLLGHYKPPLLCNFKRIEDIQTQRQECNLNKSTSDSEDNPDKQFLMSLMPIITNMSEKEKREFRYRLINSTNSKELPSDVDSHEEVIVNVAIPKQSTINKSHQTEHTSTNTNDVNNTTEVKKNKRDEFSIYGEYVASKLRNIPNAQARHTTEFHINGILYKAEMGEFDVCKSREKTLTNTARKDRTISIAEEEREEEEEDEEDFITTFLKREIIE